MKDADFGLYLIHISESLRNVLEYTKDIEYATFATEKMRQDAERYAKEDEERKAAVETRNQAEQIAYQAEKMLKENGDKVPADAKAKIEGAVNELKDALKGTDAAAIKAKQEALMQILQTAGAAMYQQPGANPAGGPTPGADAGAQSAGEQKKGGDDVVDADFKMN